MTEQEKKRYSDARSKIISARFTRLNDRQREAVYATEGPTLILAGAGSGKTTVLMNRIANVLTFGRASDSDEIPFSVTAEDVAFLEQYAAQPKEENRERAERLCAVEPAEPWRVIAITFTNKAANEMKDRLSAMLGETARDVWAMTFHAACCRILRRDADRLGFDSHFAIYDTTDSKHVVKTAMQELSIEESSLPIRSVLTAISRAKDELLSPEDMRKRAEERNDYRQRMIASIYEKYQEKLRQSDALDFDDLLLMTIRLLEENEDIREYYKRRFSYVLVDEYQDTNKLQYLIVSLLTGAKHNVCVVGDDDQSIYKFRGATIENILNFEGDFPNTRVIRLEQNYRSTTAILDAANAVIANNIGRKGKTLWTENPEGEPIDLYEAPDERDEAMFVADRIFSATQRGAKYRDCAVLYRTNAQSNALEYAMQRSGIPYRIIGGHRFFDQAEIKDMLAYLYVISNPSDNFHLRRIINQPPRGIGEKTIEMMERQAAASGTPLEAIAHDARNYPSLERAAMKLTAFGSMLDEARKLLETETLPDFYDQLIRMTGYEDMLLAKGDEESLSRLDSVRELKSSIVNYVEEADEPTLSGFLEEVSLFTDIEQYDPEANAVVMMTMHAAKGLEFPHVMLVGFEEGLFPGTGAQTDREELEEERRLCYVAITRAMKTLSISYAQRRMLYGRTSYNHPSRFLAELPSNRVNGRVGISMTARRQPEPAAAPRPKPDYTAFIREKPVEKKPIAYSQGDMVEHKAFGKGMVLSVQPMGNDALMEIAFDNIGTKRLMANTADRYLHKL